MFTCLHIHRGTRLSTPTPLPTYLVYNYSRLNHNIIERLFIFLSLSCSGLKFPYNTPPHPHHPPRHTLLRRMCLRLNQSVYEILKGGKIGNNQRVWFYSITVKIQWMDSTRTWSKTLERNLNSYVYFQGKKNIRYYKDKIMIFVICNKKQHKIRPSLGNLYFTILPSSYFNQEVCTSFGRVYV